MKKRFIFIGLMLLAVFTLVACDGATELSAITFAGVDDITLDYAEAFNVLDGVTAIGNDDVDYSDQITYSHVATTVVTDDVLDTTKAGQHTIKYSVEVEGILAEKFRFITVSDPVAAEGEMLVNADFSDGTMGWVDNKAYFVDQAALTLTTEEVDGNPALKAEVTAGWEAVRPRFGQLNIPFELGKTYEVSFDAKSSVDKTITIQMGELLDAAPWIVDFMVPDKLKVDITTEWDTYSFKFTMNLDNQNGGILLGLGAAVPDDVVDATMYFDNFAITETTPDVDETAPILSGLTANKSLLVNNEFDPLDGVTAIDNQDGNLTDKISLVIFKGSAIVSEVDTTEEGSYLLVYLVTDKAGNRQRFEMKLEVVGMQFSDSNLIVNPSFEAALNETTPEWVMWSQDWGTMPTVVTELDTTAGTYSLDITGGGDAAWAVQFAQDGITLVEGNTYRLTVVAQAEVARKINVAVGYGDPWVEYARFDGQELGTDETTLELLFTVTEETHAVKVNFELGTQDGFADGLVTFSEVKLQEAALDDLLMNPQINDGWTLWYQDGFWATAAPNVTYDRTNGTFNIGMDTGGDAFWAVQFNQNVELEADTTYTLSFDASATADRNINVEVIGTDLLGDAKGDYALTATPQTFTVDVTPAAGVEAFMLSFELGNTSAFAAGTISLDNISIKEKDNATAAELIVNGDATTVPYFMYDNAGAGAGTMVLNADGDAVIDVTALGDQPYTPHLYQMIEQLYPGNYVLKIVLDSTVDRDLRVNMVLPNADYASIFSEGFVDFEVLSTETNVIYVEFTVTNTVTDIKFELDFGTLGGDLTSVIGVFTIQEILVYQDFN